jgi:hypothetical protein
MVEGDGERRRSKGMFCLGFWIGFGFLGKGIMGLDGRGK